MGRLITLSQLDPNPSWYFLDAYYSWESRRWTYKWPSDTFPYCVSIHNDDLKDYRDRKIEIRKWIEANVQGPVIMDEVDKHYRVYYSDDRHWDHSYERSNMWTAFYFETEGEALLFRLTFSEYVKDITDLHPTSGDEYEKTSYHKNY